MGDEEHEWDGAQEETIREFEYDAPASLVGPIVETEEDVRAGLVLDERRESALNLISERFDYVQQGRSYFLNCKQMTIAFIPISCGGACSRRGGTHYLVYNTSELETGKMVVQSPPCDIRYRKNMCFFKCLEMVLKEADDEMIDFQDREGRRTTFARRCIDALELDMNEGVLLQDTQRIVQYYGEQGGISFSFGVRILDSQLNILETCEFLTDSYAGEEFRCFELVLALPSKLTSVQRGDEASRCSAEGVIGHYMILRKRKAPVCAACGRVFMSTHVCDPKRASYFQNEIRKKNVLLRPDKSKGTPKTVPFSAERLFCYDLETRQQGPSHVVYAAGFKKGSEEYQAVFGRDALAVMVECMRSSPGYYGVAWNGSRFDAYFIMAYLLEQGVNLSRSNLIISHGRILSLDIPCLGKDGGVFKLWDPCQFLSMSLDKACKSFDVPSDAAKSIFPHSFIDSEEKLDYVGEMPDDKYYPSDPSSMRKVAALRADPSHQALWRTGGLKAVCLEYLRKDVESLPFIVERFAEAVYSSFGTNITGFMTMSQMGWFIFCSSLHDRNDISPIFSFPYNDNAKLKQCVYGGRTIALNTFWQASDYELVMANFKNGIEQDVDQLTDWLEYLDVNSLYPTAMQELFPTGEPRLAESQEELNTILAKGQDGDWPMGLFKVSFSAPNDIEMPVLPKRERQSLAWNLEPGLGWYVSVDLNTAVAYGYTFHELLEAYLFPNAEPVFKSTVDMIYEMKREAKQSGNKAQYNASKLAMNSIYGKTLQRARIDKSLICRTERDILKFLGKYSWSGWRNLGSAAGVLMIGDTPSSARNAKTRPNYLGAYVLAYSRAIMMNIYDIASPGLRGKDVFYTDTDSVIVSKEGALRLRLQGLCHDDELGKLSNDLPGDGKILQLIAVSPKTYALVYMVRVGCSALKCDFTGGESGGRCPDCSSPLLRGALKETIKSKGISDKLATYEDFERLHKGQAVVHSWTSLSKTSTEINRKAHEAGVTPFSISEVVMRRTMKPINNGRVSIPNSTFTLPHGHKDIPLTERRAPFEGQDSSPEDPFREPLLTRLDSTRFFVYLLVKDDSDDGYVGLTENPDYRELQHRGERPGGAKHTQHWKEKARMALVLSGFKRETDARWFEHSWKNKDNAYRNKKEGGSVHDFLLMLQTLLNRSGIIEEKFEDSVLTIEWRVLPGELDPFHREPFITSSYLAICNIGRTDDGKKKKRSKNQPLGKVPLFFSITLFTMLPPSFLFQPYKRCWLFTASLAIQGAKRHHRGFEGESENDDDIPVYDSDNDPEAEKCVPLDENYRHDEVYEGEEDIGSFITQEGMTDSDDDSASFHPESCPSPASTLGAADDSPITPMEESIFDGTTTDGDGEVGSPTPPLSAVGEDFVEMSSDSSFEKEFFEYEQVQPEEAYFDDY